MFAGVFIAPHFHVRPDITLVDQAVDTTARAGSYTFSGLTFGEEFASTFATGAARTRTMVAMVHLVAGGSGTLNQTSCTIGGVSAGGGDSGDSGTSPTGGAGAGIWAAKPSGTSGNLTVNFTSGTANACAVYLYAVADLTSATPFASSVGPGGAGGITSDPAYPASMNGTINIPSSPTMNSVLFGAASRANNTGAITLVGITQTYDTTLGGSHRIAGGFDIQLPQQTSRTVGLSTASSGVIFGMRAMSFG